MARPLCGYQISEIGVVTLKNTSGLILNKKYSVANLKHYFQEESDDISSTAIRLSNFWSDALDKIVEMILFYAYCVPCNNQEIILKNAKLTTVSNPLAKNSQKL